MDGAAPANELLSAHGIEKRFAGTHALRGVDFGLRSGEIHALIGANGAGKSTLARILAGLYRPDGGLIRLNGEEVSFLAPREAMDAGVTLVTQETSLAPHLTALENIFLPELGKPGRLNWKALRRRAEALIDDLSIDIHFSLDDEVNGLSMANRQLVEILKVLTLNSRVIFLDEPTTSLSPYECDRLLELSKTLARKGHGLVLVTHRMEEIFSFTDRMTVLREGQLIAAGLDTAAMDSDRLIRLMVGRELSDVYSRQHAARSFSGTALRLSHIGVGQMVKDVSFDVSPNEILGLGGLVGSGRTETVEAAFGLRPLDRGTMELFGEPYLPDSPREAIRRGVGFVGENRRRHGLIPDLDVRENLLLAYLGQQQGISPNYAAADKEATSIAESLGLRPERLRDPDILKFSGGMQQKVILARWLLLKPRLLILDEPTRGVDIETRSSIYRALRMIAANGAAIVVVSSDFEELLGISDRIVVLSDGKSVADIPSSFLDIERLTMLSAPRSSAGQIGNLLTALATRYRGQAVWAHRDSERAFCFEVAAHPATDATIRRGTFIPDSLGFGIERDWTVVPVRGRQGQSLGVIGVTATGQGARPEPEELSTLVHQELHPTRANAA